MVIDCQWCGKQIERIPARLKKNKHQFCSRNCYISWQRSAIKIMQPCLFCGKAVTGKPSRMKGKVFCSQICSRLFREKKEIRYCDSCGKTIVRIPSQFRNDHSFCSRTCHIAWQRAHPKSLSKPCSYCGKSVFGTPSRLKGKIFCSSSCFRRAKIQERETRDCEFCGNQVIRPPSQFKNQQIFCNKECYTNWQKGRIGYRRSPEHKKKMSTSIRSNPELMARLGRRMREYNLKVKKGHTWEELYGPKRAAKLRRNLSEKFVGNGNPNFGNSALRGERNPNWQGGIAYLPYGPGFTNYLKREIRERDKYVCQLCNMTESEHLENFERTLIVHHINYCKMENNYSNLITLCLSCNSKVNSNREYFETFFKRKIQDLDSGVSNE